MNQGPLLFLGIFLTVAASWFGTVLGPYLQLGDQEMVTIEETGQTYPNARPGLAKQGAELYRANGCFYCHTQQIRPWQDGNDLARKWGKRRTVSRDYLRDQPVMLGNLRLGPDLANIGERQTNAFVLFTKLYDARLSMPGSTMPCYPFLFNERPRIPGQRPAPDALELPPGFANAGVEIVPRPEAYALVAYLESLKADPVFYEVFPPPKPKGTNAVNRAKGTNQPPPVTATNQVTTNQPPVAAPHTPPTAAPAKAPGAK